MPDLNIESGLTVAPGVFDGLSARIIQEAGFSAVYASGGAIARSFGLPDIGLLTMTEVLDRVHQIVEAVTIPVIADADTGYGNAINVGRTVREFERQGVSAIHLEDQTAPKRCGHLEGKELVSAAEMVSKLHAALDARGGTRMKIIARTDARAVRGVDEAIARATLYREAGADLTWVEAPETMDEINQIARSVPGPLVINMFHGGKTPLVGADELRRMGYRLMIVPSDLQRAALAAMQRVAAVLRRDGSSEAALGEMASFPERDRIVQLGHYSALEQKYAADQT